MRVKYLAQEHNAVPRPGLEPGLPDLESSALTIRPPCLPHIYIILLTDTPKTLFFSLCIASMISTASTVMFWYMVAIFDILQKENNRIQGRPIIKLIVRTFTYPLSNCKQQVESKTYTKSPLSFP